MNLVELFLAHAEARPTAPALITANGNTISYGALARASGARARAFAAAGIGKGDVVLVARGVSPELYAALIGLFRLGAVALFPEPAAGLKGLAVAVEAAKPKALIAGALGRMLRPFVAALRLPVLPEPDARGPNGFWAGGSGADGPGPNPAAPSQYARGDGPLVAVGADAPALITFTSGSTGRAKGIVRTSGFLLLQHRLLEDLRRTSPDDVDLISLPVFILSNLAAGAASVIPVGDLRRPARLDGSRLRDQIARCGVRRIVAPPSVCARIVEGAGPLPGLSAVFTGGGPVFPNLLRQIQATAPKARIYAVYGSTEAEPIAHLEMGDIAETDWRAMEEGAGLLAGAPIADIAVDIVDHEIQVAGPHVNRGYLNPEDDKSTKCARDGVLWHRTGDAGRIDAQGRLWLLGRREAAAQGLFPFAVETAALSWRGVRQAALLADDARARLVIAGDDLDAPALARRTRDLWNADLVVLPAIPMDKRHNSKIDYARLRRIVP